MILKENNIIYSVVTSVLTEGEDTALRKLLASEDNYQKFLIKLFEIVIGKEKTTLQEFLDLHFISGKLREFQNQTEFVIQALADLSFKGYVSEYTAWLQENKNSIFLEHILFLKEAENGISETARRDIKKRLLSLDKLNEFELTDFEIRAAVTIIERKILKERFKQIDSKLYNQLNRKTHKFKYSTVIILIIVSSIVFAVSIPKVRNYLKQKLNEMFDKNESKESVYSKLKATALIIPKDTITFQGKADSSVAKTEPIKSKRSYDFSNGVNKNVTIATYIKYFIKHKNDLKPIEGIYELIGTFKNYGNVIKTRCAIKAINDDKFEMVYFDDAGKRRKLHYKYFLTKTAVESKFEILEYTNKTPASRKTATLQNKDIINFQVDFILSEFNVVTDNKNEKVLCTFKGHKKMLKMPSQE